MCVDVKEKNALLPNKKRGDADEKEADDEDSDEKRESDIFSEYLRTSSDRDESEHDRYMRVKAELTRVHEDKMAKVRDSDAFNNLLD